MAQVNSSIYGSSENWLKVTSYNANIEEKSRLKFVNFTNDLTDTNGSHIYKGVDAGTIVPDEEFDSSISYCGIGSELPLANLKISRAAMIYHYGDAAGLDDGKTYEDLIETDDIEQQDSVVNFAFSRIYTPSSFLHPGAIYLVNVGNDYRNCQHQRWSPDAITTGNAPDSGFTFYNNVTQYDEMVAQIPVKNTILVPYIYAMDDRTVENPNTICVTPSEYFDTEGEDSYLDYPYVWSVGVQLYTKTRAEDQGQGLSEQWDAVQLNGLTVLNPSKIAEGFKCDPDPLDGYPQPDDREPMGDILYYTYCVNNVSNIVPILGKITAANSPNVNCPVNGTQNEDASIYGPYGVDYYHGSKISTVATEIWAGPTPDETYYSDPEQIWTNNHSRKYWTLHITAQNADDFREDIRHATAGFGLFFVEDASNVSLPLDDEDMFLGYFRNHDGIGHGDYSRGEDNRDQEQWDWDDMHDGEYDPEGPQPEPGDDPAASDNPLLPIGLTWTLANTGTGIWALTPSEIGQVWKDIFGTTADLSKFGNQPMNAILSLKWTPFTWSTNGSAPIVLGDQIVNDIHVYPLVDSVGEAEQHGYGQMKFKFNKNFYNARNMQARLFLPFYGYYELPAAQLLSSRLRVDFYYNIPDELGVWIISYDNVIYDFVECSCDMEIPLTGSNAAAIRENKKSEALTIATQVASTLVTLGNTSLSNLAGGAAVNAIDRYGGVGAIMGAGQGSLGSKLSTVAAYGAGKIASTALPYAGVGITGGINIYNTVHQAQIQRAALRTNLPYHGSALQTTFLHMSMKPYVQIFKNTIMSNLATQNGGKVTVELGGDDETEYKLKVGHACDIFAKISDMPENSLLQTTGLANNSTAGMELSEIQELSAILQSGFLR